MEWSWRTLLILLGLALVVFIVVDGLRRMRKQKNSLRMSLEPSASKDSHHANANPELPSGGYRVRSAADHSKTEPLFGQEPISSNSNSSTYGSFEFKAQDDRADFSTELFEPDAFASTATTAATPSAAPKSESKPEPEPIVAPDFPEPKLIPKARPVNLDEAVPMLLDVEELGADEQSAPAIHVEPPKPVQSALDLTPNPEAEPLPQTLEVELDIQAQTTEPEHGLSAAFDEAVAVEPSAEEEVADLVQPIPLYPVNFAAKTSEKLSTRPDAELVLVIHAIAAPDQPFNGKDIIYLFNSCDLLFGEKDIFHRYEHADGLGHIQFSVVPSYEPQHFTPATMAKDEYRGLSFFVRLPGVDKPHEAYEAMLGLAMVLHKQFNAELFDGARSAFTQQTIEHDRQQITDYERSQRLAKMKNARS